MCICDVTSRTDEELLPFFLEPGHDECTEELLRRRQPEVWRVCRFWSTSREDAEDAVQDTWIRVHGLKSTFTPDGRLGPARRWINSVAWPRARGQRTTKVRRQGRHQDHDLETLADWRDDPALEGELGELQGRVLRLGPLSQAVLIFTSARARGQGSHTGTEVADLLGLSGPSAVTRLLDAGIHDLGDPPSPAL
jgi:DNA-directed RNA polymerase specialized sigma24 family protein